jgi:predicted porin
VMEATYNLSGAAKGMVAGMNNGSEFRLGGVEDLGNGMKADFNYAVVNNHNTASTLTNYNSYVGLSGDFGSIKIGKQFTPLDVATWGNDSMAGAANRSNTLATGAGTQADGSITYTTPSIAGITVALQGGDLAKAATKSTGYSLTYAAGPFSASYSSNTVGTAKAINAIGANYDLGMAKVFLTTLNQSGQSDATGFGVSVPVGAATLIASYADKGAESAYEMVAKYNLSKRTVVYFQNKVTDAGASAAAATTNAVGIQHAF